ncbi:MAG: transcription-repair coupling factor, partial [Alphaproteobacteria bacterium]
MAELAMSDPEGRPLLHVARDDARMARLAEALRFFMPEADIVTVPAWDCLPYDRVPPHADVAARRVSALVRLTEGAETDGRRVVITTVSAILQRLPPRETFIAATFAAHVGDRIATEELTTFLVANGYSRAGTVREPGEYAIRGGIIDVYPPGGEEPARLDFFGDELEGVRGFDAITQRTTDKREGVFLVPVSEALLNERSIERFRTGYRAMFGAIRGVDPLYEAVSAGRQHPGMEHWLPLFHDRLETLFDLLPDTPITLDDQATDAVEARLELIRDYYEARLGARESKDRDPEGAVYNPLPPDALYLTWEDWKSRLAKRPVGQLSAFSAPESDSGMIDLGGRRVPDFSEARNRQDIQLLDTVRTRFANAKQDGLRIVVAAYSKGARDRVIGLMRDHEIHAAAADTWTGALAQSGEGPAVVVLGLESGFTIGDLALYTEQDIFGDRLARRARKARRADNFISEVSSLNPQDLVVHVDHGIGRYAALETLEIGGAPHDCLRILYAGGDKLYIPVENLEVLSRYGSEDADVPLDKLGGVGWQSRKARIKKRINDIAQQLLEVAAARELRRVPTIMPPAGLYEEFVARFPYYETDDQDRAIAVTIDDLGAGRPMDRLICGDVGFGKTEVALRAAFVAAMNGHQVAVVVPTTLLARQHYQTFRERFAGLPIRIEQLSRLVSSKKAREVRDDLASGQVDIIIGTHVLLGRSIRFRDLGVLIVDEEQWFGVAQKEQLKKLKADVHVLTLTATPIPRTLQLALSGVRELSLIATPPVDRLAVRTFVLPYDPVIVREAIMREHFRGGQIFYISPRIEDLPEVEERLKRNVPEIKFAVAHGQLPARELERVMSAFYDGDFHLLLSTSIVESGLDIPRANTIIIHRADMFGLAQLYQLRGRVGRSKMRAYAYLTVPADRKLTTTARQRLDVMQTLDTLGAGFSLASHDLDIRGAGNLLGEEQSGHIKEVGVELYQQMLEEAVAETRDAKRGPEVEKRDEWTPSITVGTPILIPEAYVSDLDVRLSLYRRIANLVSEEEIEGFAAEMIDRFGSLPPEVENLLSVIALKRLCRNAGVEKLDAGPKGAVVSFRKDRFADPTALVAFITRQAGTVKLRP